MERPDLASPEVRELRRQVALACRILYKLGLADYLSAVLNVVPARRAASRPGYPGHARRVRCAAHEVTAPGEQVRIDIDMTRVVLIDPQTDKVI